MKKEKIMKKTINNVDFALEQIKNLRNYVNENIDKLNEVGFDAEGCLRTIDLGFDTLKEAKDEMEKIQNELSGVVERLSKTVGK
jgi:hypothetical protein